MNNFMKDSSSTKIALVNKFSPAGNEIFEDHLAVEEPLEISLQFFENKIIQHKKISVTMRTPGNDAELAAGFLFTEGIFQHKNQIKKIVQKKIFGSDALENTTIIICDDHFVPDLQSAERNFYTTSSCGVCGKSSIDSIKTESQFLQDCSENIQIDPQVLHSLPVKLRSAQQNFQQTGGIHASALFDAQGNLLSVREDVGRHNALDKLIGAEFLKQNLPLNKHILLLSGRASFELVQKAAMAGIKIIAAIGSPSSLAVELAKDFDITLIGFLRENSFNKYHEAANVSFLDHEN